MTPLLAADGRRVGAVQHDHRLPYYFFISGIVAVDLLATTLLADTPPCAQLHGQQLLAEQDHQLDHRS